MDPDPARGGPSGVTGPEESPHERHTASESAPRFLEDAMLTNRIVAVGAAADAAGMTTLACHYAAGVARVERSWTGRWRPG